MATVVPKASVVLLVPPGRRVSRARRELKDALVPVVSRVSKVPRVTLATVVPRVRAAAVLPDLRVPRASKVQRAAVVLLDLGLAVRLGQWDLVASVERWVSRDRRVILVRLVRKALVDVMVSRVIVVPLVQWAALAFVVPRATRVSLASRARLV